ncbi:cytochrome b5-related protein [Neocloeon triangulifer]|uniref:cytochrome b5-related protein n=1 Tax=Neocloeon triangulifer TaxID=2078957 RepID=UPI00286F8E5A|nr:cytochrome b5-related protein [Neocloeon triangulifer]
MSPRTSSFPGLWKYPTNRDAWTKSALKWIEGRRLDDGAEGLWRIQDHLYDFTSFIEMHPGGPEWLLLTKGTDITEAFEVHHLTSAPKAMLEKYKIRPALTLRNSPYTFHKDGFYNRMKSTILREFPVDQLRGSTNFSKSVTDVVAATFFALSLLSAHLQSYLLALLSGFFLAMTVSAAHNFVHMRDTEWRRFYVSLSMLSAKHFRVYHTLSHHLYPNSVLDLEVSLLEPWLPWLPRQDKTFWSRYVTWVITPIVYAVVFPLEYARRICGNGPDLKNDLIPLTVPILMSLLGPSWHLWPIIILTSSFTFSLTSINAGHHHPEVVHDGDSVRGDRDWGLAQVDCVIDRGDLAGVRVTPEGQIRSSPSWMHSVLVLCNFGHHTLHHLFPTIDHYRLRKLYPQLERTMAEFGIRFRTSGAVDLVGSQFLQLARNKPNLIPPDQRDQRA